jgi:hypothetical protein
VLVLSTVVFSISFAPYLIEKSFFNKQTQTVGLSKSCFAFAENLEKYCLVTVTSAFIIAGVIFAVWFSLSI